MISRPLVIAMVLRVFLVQAVQAVLHLAAVISLEKLLAGKETTIVNSGGWVSLLLTAGDEVWRQNLTICLKGRKLEELTGTFYSLRQA